MNGHERQRESSKRMIEDALFELMKEKNYEKITVSELVKRADVARRTFYRLYNRKEDILEAYFMRLYQEYKDGHGILQNYDVRQIAREYFSFWYQHRDVLLLLHQSGLDSLLLYYIMGYGAADIVKERIMDEQLRCVKDMEYFAAYSMGGFGNLLYQWISKGMKGNPEQYAEDVSDVIVKFL
ncbi:MAG: TetR/AcrR family transcriptional regulator [Eubacteriales bacterium]|nr:TetR/AcrR family transcriptional regulator [Eubacteriales bacterium]